MRLTFLNGLRLNCWLAPLLPLMLALIIMGGLHHRHHVQAQVTVGTGMADTLALVAQLGVAGYHPDVSIVRLADDRWTGMARVRWVSDESGVTVMAADGVIDLRPAEPSPNLLLSVNGPRWWVTAAGNLAVAAVERDVRGNVAAFWYGETPAPEIDWRPLAWAAAALLSLGGLLAWYLARHLWRPIFDLQQMAEAALRGEVTAPAHESEETASLRTAIIHLAERSSVRQEAVRGE